MTSAFSEKASPMGRFAAFLRKPWHEQAQSFGARYLRWIPHAVLPIRLPVGAWLLAEHDFIGSSLLWKGFENAEYGLAAALVKPGMSVLDIGAHKGFYSLLFSRKVGARGRVLAFEPSGRERSRLKLHLRLNSCRNVEVFDCALGEGESQADLFVVHGTETGLNSLKPPMEAVRTHRETVKVRSLDTVLKERNWLHVDFVKIDVEGAELAVFSGATDLLRTVPRPMILAEVSDVRAKAWGHTATDLLALLERHGFQWFASRPEGGLVAVDRGRRSYDDNFLAVPEEKRAEIDDLLA